MQADIAQSQQQDVVKPIVLLVDDEENIVKSLARTLRKCAVDIVTATSGKEALYVMENTEVDLIISDMRMPGMSGAEFLEIAARDYPSSVRILLTGYSDLESTIAAVNKGKIACYMNKPWNDEEIRQIVNDNLRAKILEVKNQQLSLELIEKNKLLEELNTNLEAKVSKRTEQLDRALREINQSYEHMVMLASSIASLRDEKSAKAATLKAAMAEEIALKLGMPDDEVAAVRDAMLLCDLGKMGFSDRMLNKPYSDYDAEEMRLFKQYPLLGEAALLGIPDLFMAGVYVRNQFERFDGSGFPDKLAGERIPNGSLILAVVRDYIDLVLGKYTGTEYQESKAKNEIVRFSGVRYDPKIVDIFSEIYLDFSTDRLADGEKLIRARTLREGMVLSRNLLSSRGMVLLKRGHLITESVANKIVNLEQTCGDQLDVYVYMEEIEPGLAE